MALVFPPYVDAFYHEETKSLFLGERHFGPETHTILSPKFLELLQRNFFIMVERPLNEDRRERNDPYSSLFKFYKNLDANYIDNREDILNEYVAQFSHVFNDGQNDFCFGGPNPVTCYFEMFKDLQADDDAVVPPKRFKELCRVAYKLGTFWLWFRTMKHTHWIYKKLDIQHALVPGKDTILKRTFELENYKTLELFGTHIIHEPNLNYRAFRLDKEYLSQQTSVQLQMIIFMLSYYFLNIKSFELELIHNIITHPPDNPICYILGTDHVKGLGKLLNSNVISLENDFKNSAEVADAMINLLGRVVPSLLNYTPDQFIREFVISRK